MHIENHIRSMVLNNCISRNWLTGFIVFSIGAAYCEDISDNAIKMLRFTALA
jgi:hypothetical protein